MANTYSQTKRQRLEIQRGQLELERSSFLSHWREIADFMLPRRPRFQTTDTNRGDRRNQKIIDATATLALRTLRSGMMSGITSPARPWFRLTTPDPDLAEFGSVKQWLHTVSQRMTTVFLRSNLYNALPIVYGDIGGFGSAALMMEEDLDDVVRFYPFPIGSYCIANNDRLKVDVFTREFRMTVRQLVQRYGRKRGSGSVDWSNFSTHVRNQWDNSNYETWVDVCHAISPNPEYDPKYLGAKNKKYESCTYEKGALGTSHSDSFDVGTYLKESGYDYFPVLAPRWETTGEDSWGTSCPGMDALGDVKQLQLMQKRKAQAVEKMVNPPMKAPTSMRTSKASILPGDITYVDEREHMKGFSPAHEVNLPLSELREDIRETQDIIRRAFFEDLFLMLAQSDRREITAREIEERHEEKLLALGPVLEQLNQDLLDPLIDTTFSMLERQRLLPEPPEELQGVQLKVEYLSIMAQAQKTIGIAGVERFAGFVRSIAEGSQDPSVLDKVDIDQMIDVYGDLTSVPPGIVRTDDAVEEIRQGRQKAAQAQQSAESLQNVAGAARDLSQTDTGGKNALTDLMSAANAGSPLPEGAPL